MQNEEPRRRRRGIEILPKPTLLRSPSSGRVLPALHPRGKGRDIRAEENKTVDKLSKKFIQSDQT